MKRFKMAIGVMALAGLGLTLQAEAGDMDARDFELAVTGTNTTTKTYTVRGSLEAVYVAVPAGAQTGKVTVASSELTLFEQDAVAASAAFLPRAATHTTAGVAATFVGGSNNTANAWYACQPMAGPVTVTVVGQSAATNGNYTVRLIYRR